jgi:hypothetical protein
VEQRAVAPEVPAVRWGVVRLVGAMRRARAGGLGGRLLGGFRWCGVGRIRYRAQEMQRAVARFSGPGGARRYQ